MKKTNASSETSQRKASKKSGRKAPTSVEERASGPSPMTILFAAAAGAAVSALIVQRVRSGRWPRLPMPSLAALLPPQKSMLRRGVESAGMSLLTLGVQRLGARAYERLLPEVEKRVDELMASAKAPEQKPLDARA